MTLVSLVTLVLVLALVGFLLYLIVTYIPMPAPMQQVIVVVVVIVLVLWLLSALLGGGGGLPTLRIG